MELLAKTELYTPYENDFATASHLEVYRLPHRRDYGNARIFRSEYTG